MAEDRITVDYDVPLGTGHVRLTISTPLGPSGEVRQFLLAVMDKVAEFARAVQPDAPAPVAGKPAAEVVGQFGPRRAVPGA